MPRAWKVPVQPSWQRFLRLRALGRWEVAGRTRPAGVGEGLILLQAHPSRNHFSPTAANSVLSSIPNPKLTPASIQRVGHCKCPTDHVTLWVKKKMGKELSGHSSPKTHRQPTSTHKDTPSWSPAIRKMQVKTPRRQHFTHDDCHHPTTLRKTGAGTDNETQGLCVLLGGERASAGAVENSLTAPQNKQRGTA